MSLTSSHDQTHLVTGFAAVDEDSSYSGAERSLRQVLHQLTHLQKVWQDVLPESVYHKAIGACKVI